jgi:nucleoside-diphosphate-sugar epimerase
MMLLLLKNRRVLITGASGWFGREVLSLCHANNTELFCTASQSKLITVGNIKQQVHQFNLSEIENFAPDYVIDCSGLNRNLENSKDYLNKCLKLTNNYLDVMALSSVKAGMTFSSGAALFDPNDVQFSQYSRSKIVHEKLVRDAKKPSVIMRCFAVSGKHCQSINNYAFSDFIYQAKHERVIRIKASQPVYRRYMAFEDYFAIGLSQLESSITLESGGEWIELGDLAEMIAEKTGSKIVRDPISGAVTRYGSDSNQLEIIGRSVGITVKNLQEQIEQLI